MKSSAVVLALAHPVLLEQERNLERVHHPGKRGAWMQIPSSTTDSTYAVSFFPHDDRILLTHDRGGNELNHLYVRTPAGEERDLTPGDKLKAEFVDWSHDGTAFFVSTNERDAKFMDVYRYHRDPRYHVRWNST